MAEEKEMTKEEYLKESIRLALERERLEEEDKALKEERKRLIKAFKNIETPSIKYL